MPAMRTARWTALLVALFLSACTAPDRTAEPLTQSFTTVDDIDRGVVWDTCQDVLRDHRFRIDRLDRRSGVITTYPETSQHFFEFWRHDVDTPYDFMEASLVTMRRSVTVHTEYNEPQGQTHVTVTVRRERFSTPERQFNSSLAAFRMFGEGLPAEATGRPVGRAQDYWIDDGRDPAMEQCLLAEITRRTEGG